MISSSLSSRLDKRTESYGSGSEWRTFLKIAAILQAYCLLSLTLAHDGPGCQDRLGAGNEEADGECGTGIKRGISEQQKIEGGRKLNITAAAQPSDPAAAETAESVKLRFNFSLLSRKIIELITVILLQPITG